MTLFTRQPVIGALFLTIQIYSGIGGTGPLAPLATPLTTLVSHHTDNIQQPTKSPDYLLGEGTQTGESQVRDNTTAGLFASVSLNCTEIHLVVNINSEIERR